jgi:hypothetical protein
VPGKTLDGRDNVRYVVLLRQRLIRSRRAEGPLQDRRGPAPLVVVVDAPGERTPGQRERCLHLRVRVGVVEDDEAERLAAAGARQRRSPQLQVGSREGYDYWIDPADR